MNIPFGTPVSGINRAYGPRAYKKNAAYVPKANSTPKTKNTDKIEFSSSEASGEKILPERYKDSGAKIYYKGELITEYELLETAVKTGAITLDETKSTAYNVHNAAEALIYSKASKVYPWSNTLYSEDRMYVFRVENGKVTGMTKTWFDDGTTILDVANDLANGIRPCDIDPCKRDWLMRCDPELYKAACEIGGSKRSYFQETAEYMNGHLTKQQYLSEMDPIFTLFFGGRADVRSQTQHNLLRRYMGRSDFGASALRNYSK